MGRLDFLYRMELPHRAVAVYLYLSLSKGTVPGAARAACFFRSGNRDRVKYHLPPRGNCALLVKGGTCHGDRRK